MPSALKHEEQRHLAARAGPSPVSPGPVPVAEIGDHGGDGDREALGGQRLVLEQARVTGVPKQVEDEDVDDEADATDDPELRRLADRDGAVAPAWLLLRDRVALEESMTRSWLTVNAATLPRLTTG